ncbi:hypothetical protein Cni_G05030 [Canna indica]|uniref:Transcriptional coactivator Hfi1/Transcriptional adapter 1 n=1 Tax=Canna indica TaxID=4628 RepID=A0AAQ3Q3B5_9LILI|nr:hypothetical protein Cni_G05030 [Canna indica]
MPQPPMLQQQTPLPPAQVMKHSRSNLGDLKSQIAKRLGQERAQRYFSYLNGFLSQKLNKREFTKLCVLTIGQENLPLHNQLIRSIIQNACQAKVPPPFDHDKFTQMATGIALKKSSQVDGLAFSQAPSSVPQNLSNGDLSPQLPHKYRTGIDNHRIKDSSILCGPNSRAQAASHLPPILSDEAVLGKNDDLKRAMQQLQHEPNEQPTKRAKIDDHGYVHKKVIAELPLDHREDLDHRGDLDSFRNPLRAPLGIPFCSASIGGARRPLQSSVSTTTDSFCGSYDCSELYDTEVLKQRMEKMAEAHDLQGVTMDCANLLNNGLDAYLKRLIRSCVELVGARTRHVLKQSISNMIQNAKPNTSVLTGNNIQVQGSIRSLEGMQVLSMQDFKVAMELNPQQLGEDWPLLLEKICGRSFEE